MRKPEVTTPSQEGSNHTFFRLVAFAAPVCGSFFLINPSWGILAGVYAKYFGLPLASIAMVALLSRLLDAVSDPLVGYISDHHVMGGGSRKTWVIGGGLYLLVASWFLFSPPDYVTWKYYLFWSINFYLAWTIMDVPHAAWGGEIAHDHQQRSRVYSFRTTFIFLGQIIFFALPLLPIFSNSEYTPETLRFAVLVGIVLIIPALVFAKSSAPEGRRLRNQGRDSLSRIIQSITANPPLLIFISTYIFAGFSFGLYTGVQFLYLDGYLHLGDKIAVVLLLGNVAALASIPGWLKLMKMTNKSFSWACGMGLYVISVVGFYLIEPQNSWWFSLIMTSFAYIGFACLNIAVTGIVADISDYGALRFKVNRGGSYFALLTFLYKATMGIGAALSLWFIGLYEFDATAEQQTDDAIWGIKMAFILFPMISGLCAVVFVNLNPLTREKHDIVVRYMRR